LVCSLCTDRNRRLANFHHCANKRQNGDLVAQMVLNWLWSPVWFTLHALWPALAIILAILLAIIAFIAASWRPDRVAAWLFIPYAVWVAFASSLNLSIALLNP
jgi:tryptophan-rich sensory protein